MCYDLRPIQFTILFCFLTLSAFGQTGDCECKRRQSISVCFLSVDSYCNPNAGFCEYSLDGDFMAPGIRSKLENQTNFGRNGVVDCEITLKPLTDFSSVQAIEDCGCDIIFCGNFPYDTTLNYNTDFSKTAVPLAALERIKEWSIICESNLVVVTQAEANLWGYEVENLNANPNEPIASPSMFSIFDGLFGTITEFSQGGSFQGIITQVPSTGAEILSLDANDLPTVVIDNVTNDLILGDIGIFCNDPAGPVSIGTTVNNSNDILACNIFALGCQIVQGTATSFQLVEVCEGESYTLDNGQTVFLEGIYIDSLKSSLGCDSIALTQLEYRNEITLDLNFKRCLGDGFALNINGTEYNESNPIGQEILIDNLGCDSILNINLEFNAPSDLSIKDTLCENSGFNIMVGNVRYDQSNPVGQEILLNQNDCDSTVNIALIYNPISSIEINHDYCKGDGSEFILNGEVYNESRPQGFQIFSNQYGCDSTIFVDLNFISLDTTSQTIKVCEGETAKINGSEYPIGTVEYSTYTRDAQCDSVNKFEVIAQQSPIFQLDSNIIVNTGSSYTFQNEIPLNYQVNWFPPNGLSCNDCINPIILKESNEATYLVNIIDENGCLHEVAIPISYNNAPYIPTVFSPNNDGINDSFQIFFKNSTQTPIVKLFQIFDRWGGLIYSKIDLDPITSQGWWDGTMNGEKLNPGVFVFQLIIEYPNGEKLEFKGDINLVR